MTDEYKDVELMQGDDGERVISIIEKLLLTPKQPSISQRNALLRTNCTINRMVFELIIDSGRTKNVVSRAIVKELSLPTEKHPHPYMVGWIKKGVET